jgi:hypothetical protein
VARTPGGSAKLRTQGQVSNVQAGAAPQSMLMSQADAAMFAAKRAGKNHARLAAAGLDA